MTAVRNRDMAPDTERPIHRWQASGSGWSWSFLGASERREILAQHADVKASILMAQQWRRLEER